MQADLDGAAFGGQPLSGEGAKKLIHAGDNLLYQAGGSPPGKRLHPGSGPPDQDQGAVV